MFLISRFDEIIIFFIVFYYLIFDINFHPRT